MISVNDKALLKADETVLRGQKARGRTGPVLFILMGLPGVGKSRVARALHDTYRFTVLSGENITHALFRTKNCRGSQYAFAYKVLRKLAADYLRRRFSVVVDGTNLRLQYRRMLYRLATQARARPYLLEIRAADRVALARLKSQVPSYADSHAIRSSCSRRTFDVFKQQLQRPLPSEPTLRLVSNNKVKDQLREICLKVL